MDDVQFHFRLRGEEEFSVWNDHATRDPAVAARMWLAREHRKSYGVVEYTPDPTSVDPHDVVVTGPTKANYVVGFLFSEDLQKVVLIRKTKPEWQAGMLNGVGGKIEEMESPVEAMVREFEEEAGKRIEAALWNNFCTMTGGFNGGESFNVECFYAVSNLSDVESKTEEQVGVMPLDEVHLNAMEGQHSLIGNIPWLLSMAVDTIQGGCRQKANVRYD